MKSLFICSERKINYHVGEYYDDVIEVPHQPTSKIIEEVAKAVRHSIQNLWKEDVEDEERVGEPCVEAHLDAASPFNAMLIDYQIVMEKKEGIKIELAYLDSTKRTITNDEEANKLIEKLDNRGEEEDAKI